MLMNFHSLYLKVYLQNLVENCPVVYEESKFYFSCVNDLGPKSRNDLEYSRIFIYSINCLHLPTFRSQPAIVSEKSFFFSLSPLEKPKLQN